MELIKKQQRYGNIVGTIAIILALFGIFREQIVNFFTSEGLLSRLYYTQLSEYIYKNTDDDIFFLLMFIILLLIYKYYLNSYKKVNKSFKSYEKSYQQKLVTIKESEKQALKQGYSDYISKWGNRMKRIRITNKIIKIGFVFVISLFLLSLINILINITANNKYESFSKDIIILETKIPEIEIKKLKVDWIEMKSKDDYLKILNTIDGHLNSGRNKFIE